MSYSNKSINLANYLDLEPEISIPDGYRNAYLQYGDHLIDNGLADLDSRSCTLNLPNHKGTKYLNSFLYASDEFTPIHENEHVLFLGCSNGFGFGLPDKFLWSKKLLSDLFPKSGFYNLSMAGAGIEEIIFNAFNYFKIFGNPQYIFFLMPNLYRGFARNHTYAELKTFQFYKMLEMYCDASKIKLLSATWDLKKTNKAEITNEFMQNFKTFYKIDFERYTEMVYNEYLKDPKNECILESDSQGHLGIAPNEVYYKIFKQEYLNRLNS